ncbi:glucose repression mediator protein [Microbotryomycetes sp. JL201]|nr:glucose repression mediator protein [Microbotryomycetes sp. JL201]
MPPPHPYYGGPPPPGAPQPPPLPPPTIQRPASSMSTASAHMYQPATGPNQQPPPPPLSLAGGPPQQGPSVLQILQMGQERNMAADAQALRPRIDSLVKLGKEAEATWLQIGQTAESVGDLDRALAAYESALRHNAYSVVALSQIAAICRTKEDFKRAAEYFGRVVGISPDSGDVWGALGTPVSDSGKDCQSWEPKLWYGIGILYDRYGSLEHAEEAFSSVVHMDPNFEKANEIFFRLGIIYKQQRKSAQSLECFRYILQNPPRPLTEIDIWFQIGHVYEQQMDYVAAKESYERVLAENPAHAKVLQQLGGLYHRSRAPFYNPDTSVQILLKSLESDANDPFTWYLLGRAYMTQNNFGKAYEAYQQAVYRDGKNPAFWCSIGVLYFNIGQFLDALDAYSRAIRIHPYLAEVWFNLGSLYESCNDQMTDAIDAYQRTLQLEPSNTVVSNRLRDIREHQTNGTPLGPPPQPEDISPSSLSWNFAVNAGGAPAQIAHAGLGPEMSPAPGRPGTNVSPPTASQPFDSHAPPRSSHGRPQSTDPAHRAHHPPSHAPHDERRRPSMSYGPDAAMVQSPRSRLDMSSHRDDARPPMPPHMDVKRRASPTSPRSRPQSSQLPPPMFARGNDQTADAEWERARASVSSRGLPQQSVPPPPRGAPYGSHPMPWDRVARPHETGMPPDVVNGRAPGPPGYPTPYGYAPYSVHQGAPPTGPADPNQRRYDEAKVASEDVKRRGSHGSPKAEPALPIVAAAASAAASAPATKTKASKAKKDSSATASPRRGSNANLTPTAAAGTTTTTTGRGKKSASNGDTPKKERKSTGTAPKEGKKGKSKKAEDASGSGAQSPAVSATNRSTPVPLRPAPAPSTATAVAPKTGVGLSRQVDEDYDESDMASNGGKTGDAEYDEGVDALMGFAASVSAASAQQAVSTSAPPPPPPQVATSAPAIQSPSMSTAPTTESTVTLTNPRKRSIADDVEQQTETKKSKADVAESPLILQRSNEPVSAAAAAAAAALTEGQEARKRVEEDEEEEEERDELEEDNDEPISRSDIVESKKVQLSKPEQEPSTDAGTANTTEPGTKLIAKEEVNPVSNGTTKSSGQEEEAEEGEVKE